MCSRDIFLQYDMFVYNLNVDIDMELLLVYQHNDVEAPQMRVTRHRVTLSAQQNIGQTNT